jgi:predicted TIM-barrel fold metal-dependent hydrolase
MNSYYENYPAMAQSWGRMVETGTHLLRLMSGCVFDRYRDLKIIVGHMGELIPFGLERINRGLTMGSWLLAAESKKAGSAQQWAMQKSVRYYMRQNVVITTSGVFDQAALSCAIEELGIDNILFSADDPFGDNFEAVDFLENAKLSAEDSDKLAHGNAERVLNLAPNIGARKSSVRFLSSASARARARLGRKLLSLLVK